MMTRITKAQQDKIGPLTEQVRSRSKESLQCRDLRHAWEVPKGYTKVEVEGGVRGAIYVERVISCHRGCGVERIELFRIHTHWMERLNVRYVYPKDYKITGDREGVSLTGIVQLELYMRSIADFNGMEE